VTADAVEVEVVLAHTERATLRVGDVFLKIDSDQTRTDVEVAAMAMVPVRSTLPSSRSRMRRTLATSAPATAPTSTATSSGHGGRGDAWLWSAGCSSTRYGPIETYPEIAVLRSGVRSSTGPSTPNARHSRESRPATCGPDCMTSKRESLGERCTSNTNWPLAGRVRRRWIVWSFCSSHTDLIFRKPGRPVLELERRIGQAWPSSSIRRELCGGSLFLWLRRRHRLSWWR
jgi:hypothetical protein